MIVVVSISLFKWPQNKSANVPAGVLAQEGCDGPYGENTCTR